MYFLPGRTSVQLGSLLQCTELLEGRSVSTLRPVQPVTRAMLLHKLTPPVGSRQMEVIGITILTCGDVVLLTTQEKKVQIYTERGRLRHEFGDEDELQQPSDIVVTRDNELAFTDCGFHQVRVFDQCGTLSYHFGDEDVFIVPIALAMDGRGRFLVCDQMKQQVTVHRSRGEVLITIPTAEVITAQHLTWRDNVIFLGDPEHREIGIYSFNGTDANFVAKMTTGNDDGDVGFLDCSGICADNHGGLCIADAIQNKIHVLNVRGEISSITGTPAFVRPQTVAVTSSGLMAISHEGVVIPEEGTDSPTRCSYVSIYRIMRTEA